MANLTRTYLTSDWKIWTYEPFDNRFILDFSKLNDASTPLSAVDGSMKIIDALIGDLVINEGTPVSDGIFTAITPASLSVSMIMRDFTTADSLKFLVGSPIWITYRNGETYDDTVFGKNTPIFMGRIRSFNVDVSPGADFSSITIEATSYSEDDLNVLMTILKDNIVYKTDAISAAATALNIKTSFFTSYLHFGGTAVGAYETKTYGEWVGDLALCSVDIVRDDVTAMDLFYGTTTRTYNYAPGIKTTTSLNASLATRATLNQTTITDVELNWDGAGAPTGVNLTNYYNNAVIYQYGSTSSTSTGGAFNFNTTVDLKDITEMTTVGQKMMGYNRTFAPVSVNVKIATNNQNVTFIEDQLYDQGLTLRSVWLYPANLLKIGELAEITLTDFGITAYRTIVTGRTITVTPDDFTVQYNLWKGF